MKYLLLLVLAMLGLWWLRASGRARAASDAKRSDTGPENATQEMVSCTLCGLHLPHQDAVSGQRGVYCCQDHRERNEG